MKYYSRYAGQVFSQWIPTLTPWPLGVPKLSTILYSKLAFFDGVILGHFLDFSFDAIRKGEQYIRKTFARSQL